MNNQETFNLIAVGIYYQGEQCTNSIGHCAYRNESGLKCAFGQVLPDSMYEEDMEGISVETILETYSEVEVLFNGVDITLLENLQSIHDNFESGDFRNYWLWECNRTAKDYNLTPWSPV